MRFEHKSAFYEEGNVVVELVKIGLQILMLGVFTNGSSRSSRKTDGK